jgi:hypothetical protein
MHMTTQERILATVFACLTTAYLVCAAMLFSRPAQAQEARAFEACVVSVTTTSTTIAELISAQANCSRTGISGYVKIKVVGTTSVCVGGPSESTGNPDALVAGNKCYPLTTGQEFPSVVPASQMELRVQTGTSLVAVASAQGGA